MKYVDERNKKTFVLLDKALAELPDFCRRFFLGISQRTQPLTRLNYAYDLKIFFNFLSTETDTFNGKKIKEFDAKDLNNVEIFHIELFADFIRKTNGERGITRKLSCLRSFFAYYFKIGELEKNILPRVDLPKIHEKSIVRLDDDEVTDIIARAIDGQGLTDNQLQYHNKTALRDSVILTFFLLTGVRVSELVGLNVGDIDVENSSFKITRKGGNETILYMAEELCSVMTKYIAIIDRDINLPLFLSLQGKRLGVRSVENLVKKYAALASPLKKISPHKLRSTYGTALYRKTGDIYVVAEVLGHQNVNTTKQHYAAISEDIKKEAMVNFENRHKKNQ